MNQGLKDNLLYNKDYSWIEIKDDIATIGVIAPAAIKAKEFIFINLPKPKKIKKNEIYTNLEAIKWSGDLKSPLTGEIIEVNEDLFDEPETINNDAYNKWIIKLKIENMDEVKDLLDYTKAKEHYKDIL